MQTFVVYYNRNIFHYFLFLLAETRRVYTMLLEEATDIFKGWSIGNG